PKGPVHLAIGVFDGVHLGHRALIAHLGRGARNEQAAAVAATFDPLPIQVLAPGAPASALSDIHDRVRLLREAGADAVVVFRFDDAFARLLGRPYSIRGRVVHGDKRGRALGFPTINLALPKERLLPRDGIYAMWAEMGEGRFKAAASLGVRPTFGGGERVLEAYLLDFS